MAKPFSDEELKEIYVFALDLGRRAGKILIEGVEKRTGAVGGREVGKQEEKMNAVDIVTQTDLGTFFPPCLPQPKLIT
jgi:myo-inositol-1(or 4)-monophosphatase